MRLMFVVPVCSASSKSGMRRSASIAALLACMIATAACSPPDRTTAEPVIPATQPSPTPPATSEASPVPTVSATPDLAQPSGLDPDDPSTWLLSDDGVGPYQLGMPFAEALSVAQGFEDACGSAFWRDFDPATWEDDVWIAEMDDELFYVTMGGRDAPRTAEGLGVGSTTTDVLATFPDATIVDRNSRYLRAGNMFFGFQSRSDYDAPEPYLDPEGNPEEITSVGVTAGEILYEFCG